MKIQLQIWPGDMQFEVHVLFAESCCSLFRLQPAVQTLLVCRPSLQSTRALAGCSHGDLKLLCSPLDIAVCRDLGSVCADPAHHEEHGHEAHAESPFWRTGADHRDDDEADDADSERVLRYRKRRESPLEKRLPWSQCSSTCERPEGLRDLLPSVKRAYCRGETCRGETCKTDC